jgi:hypothetical protein
MGFFDFLTGGKKGIRTRDLVWMSHTAKFNGLISLMGDNPGAVIITWFPDSLNDFRRFYKAKMGSDPQIKIASSVNPYMVTGKTVFFLEHYPVKTREENLMKDWNAAEVIVLNALDEPLFTQFGSDRIAGMLQKMGTKEDEIIEHSLISKSIVNAQGKIQSQIRNEYSADSAAEWFRKNRVVK